MPRPVPHRKPAVAPRKGGSHAAPAPAPKPVPQPTAPAKPAAKKGA